MASDYKVTIKAAQPASVLSPRAVLANPGGGSSLASLQGIQSVSPSMPPMKPGYFSGGFPMPVMADGMTFKEVGSSGLRQYGGWVREEFLPQLVGRQAARTYREMMDNSAVVGALMFAVVSTMRKVEWRVEPANDSPAAQEVADFIDECRDDMSHTWTDFVVEWLSMLGYGFAPMELVYKRRLGQAPGMDPAQPTRELPKSKFKDGKIGWRRMPLRGQDTIIKWFFGPNSETLGMTQQPWIGPMIDIPIEKMLLFRPSSHKNNPEGRSILRSAYRSYFLAKRLEEQEAILFERIAGLPVVKIPGQVMEDAMAGDSSAIMKLNTYKMIATNLRVDEQMGCVLPSDMWPGAQGPSTQPMYSLELISPDARVAGIESDTSISRYNVNILTSVLADFLQLGHESRGTQSLALAKTDMFFQAIEGFLNSGAEVCNRYAIPRLLALNGISPDMAPKVTPDLAQRLDLDTLSNFILRLSQAGMPLFPDDELESWTRDQAGMPDISDDNANRLLQYSTAGIKDPDDPNSTNHPDHPDNPLNREPAPDPATTKPGMPGLNLAQTRNKILKASIVRRLLRHNGAQGHTHKQRKRRPTSPAINIGGLRLG